MTTPMSAERFSDRFRFYRDQPQQQRGVLQLHAAISSSDQGSAILDEQAPLSRVKPLGRLASIKLAGEGN